MAKRVFLVGCPRSGTTLLQTMLAQHPEIFTIPETFYFQKIRGRTASRPIGSVVSPRSAARALDALAGEAGIARPRVPRWWPTAGRYADAFTEVMDRGADREGASVWVEKSPGHLLHIDELRRRIPESRFIHLVRDGRDVVASLVRQCEREPESWVPQLVSSDWRSAGRREIVEGAIRRWNRDISLSLARESSAGHRIVSYERLVAAPDEELRGLADFLGIDYDPAMERHWEAADRVVGHRRDKEHMRHTFEPIAPRHLEAFTALFDEAEQQAITSALRWSGEVTEHLGET